ATVCHNVDAVPRRLQPCLDRLSDREWGNGHQYGDECNGAFHRCFLIVPGLLRPVLKARRRPGPVLRAFLSRAPVLPVQRPPERFLQVRVPPEQRPPERFPQVRAPPLRPVPLPGQPGPERELQAMLVRPAPRTLHLPRGAPWPARV